MRRFILATATTLMLSLGLTACTGILPRLAGIPPALYELHAPSEESLMLNPEIADLPILDAQVLVDIPQASAGIDTPRIALVRNNNTIAYFQNVSWTDRAPVMFQTLLVDSYDHTGHLPAVGRENIGLRADYLIKGELGAIQADYTTEDSAPEARIELKLKLITMPRRIIVASGNFRSTVKSSSDTMEDITRALQIASNDVLTQATVWTLNQINKKEKK